MEIFEKLVEWTELTIEMIINMNPDLTEIQWAIVVLVAVVMVAAVGRRLVKILVILVLVFLGISTAGRLLGYW